MRGFIFQTMARALVGVTSLLEDVAFRSIESRLATSAIRAAPMSKTPPEAPTGAEVAERGKQTVDLRGVMSLMRNSAAPARHRIIDPAAGRAPPNHAARTSAGYP